MAGVRIEFLGWHEPLLPRAAARLAETYEARGVLRMDGAVVALPGGRPGRRLKELLVAEAERRGARLVPPEVTTIGALPERLYEAGRPLADGALRRRVLARLAREMFARATMLLPDPPARDDVRGWTTFGREIERLQRAVGGAGLRFRDVVRHCDASLLYDDSARWSLLADLQQAYEQELQRFGFADADLERLRAVDDGSIACDADLWLVGVAEMSGVTRRMLARLEARALVHAPEDRADAFDELGCVLPAYWTSAELPLDDARIDVVQRPSDQAAAAVRRIAAQRGSRAADEIVIGVPDEDVVPYLEQQLAAAGVAVRYAAGSRVESSAPYRLLEAIADYLADGSAQAFAALVRHPDLGRWLRVRGRTHDHNGAGSLRREDGWIAPLDAYLCEVLPYRIDRSLAAGASNSRSLFFRTQVDALRGLLHSDALLQPLRSARAANRTVAEWMTAVMGALVEVYGLDEARPLREDPRGRRLLGALQQLRDAAAALYRVPAACDEPCSAATAIRLLLDDVAGSRVPPEPDHAAVELLGWLELHLDDAPVVIVTGANETVLPEAVNADVFLPDTLRARLGIEDNARRLARDAYQLAAMMHARDAYIIAGRTTAKGDPLRPSRLLLARRGEALALRVLRFLGEDGGAQPETERPAGTSARSTGGAKSRFRLPPEPVISSPEPLERLNVTDFGALLRDPYGFALARILGLEPVDTSIQELDPRGFGSLAHAVLQHFGAGDAVHSSDARVVVSAVEDALRAEVRRRFGAEPLPAVRLQVEQLRARLETFADWQAGWVREGWRVAAVECGTDREGLPVRIGGEPIRLAGRIDRIDYHAARNAWMIFDYKTGEKGDVPDAVHRKGRHREWIDLQLPLYRHIVHHVRDAAGNVVVPADSGADIGLGYILLCRDRASIGARIADWSEEELAGADACAAEVIRQVRTNAFEYSADRPPRDERFAALLGRQRLSVEDESDIDASDDGEGSVE